MNQRQEKNIIKPTRCRNPKCESTKNQWCNLPVAKADRTERYNSQIHNCNKRLKYLLSIICINYIQKTSKNIELNTINQQVLINLYRTLHSTTPDYVLFSSCPQNTYQDRLYPGLKNNKPQKQNNWDHTQHVLRL